MLFISFFVKAEENFLHDKDLCTVNGKEFDLEIRGRDKYTTVTESDYGEFITLRHLGQTTMIETEDTISRYRMLKAQNELCSKVVALPARRGELAIFILKDNRPFTDELFILNTKTSRLEKTGLFVKEALKRDGKLYFHIGKDGVTKTGTIVMHDQKYSYIEKPFESWLVYHDGKFSLDRDMTYEQFEYKAHLSRKDFNKIHNLENRSYRMAKADSDNACLSLTDDPFICISEALASK